MMSTNSYNTDFANRIANLCIEKYNKLPKTGKPNLNESQWTLLSGICLEEAGMLSVVALGTGTKCLGSTSYSKEGDVLHDSHAEVLTRRAWLRYLYSQMNLCLSGQPSRIFNLLPKEIVNQYQNIQVENQTAREGEMNSLKNSESEPEILNESKTRKNNDSRSRALDVNKTDSSSDNEHCLEINLEKSEILSSNMSESRCENNATNDNPASENEQTTHNSNPLAFKFSLRPGIKFHFYTSHTPCGDATIFPRLIKSITLAKIQTQTQRYKIQKDFLKRRKLEGESTEGIEPSKKPRVEESEEISNRMKDALDNDLTSNENVELKKFQTSKSDSTSEDSETDDSLSGDVGSMVQDFHRTGAKILPHASHEDPKGNGPNYHVTGVPRLKPGRGDPTYSMSCSDKMAKWNSVGWEGTLISTLLDSPIYMSSITVGGGIAFSMDALQRALITRVAHLLSSPQPVLLHSRVIFPAGKRSVKREMKRLGRAICSVHPIGGCIIWCNVTYKPLEVAIEGIRQGVSRKIHNRKRTSSALLVSPYKLLLQYIQLCKNPQLLNTPYSQIKARATDYQERMNRCKEALGNWLGVPEEFRQFTVADMNETL